jgi:phosphate butyryltransferase
MIFNNFQQLVDQVQNLNQCRRVALAGAQDMHSLEAVVEAKRLNICRPILIGRRVEIETALERLDLQLKDYEIVDSGDANPGQIAVEYVRDGKADFLMKGGIESRDLLKPLVDKVNNLSTGQIMNGVAISEIPSYHKLIVSVDGGMNIYPNLMQKKQIIENTVDFMLRMGYVKPKVAVLCGVEFVNPQMIETVDAAKLVNMNMKGLITDCEIVGPISYDLVMSKESAIEKNYNCPHCGDFDIILCPTLAAGNILTKSWAYSAGAKWAGLIAGARVPVVMTSRTSSANEKFLSLAVAALTSGEII